MVKIRIMYESGTPSSFDADVARVPVEGDILEGHPWSFICEVHQVTLCLNPHGSDPVAIIRLRRP